MKDYINIIIHPESIMINVMIEGKSTVFFCSKPFGHKGKHTPKNDGFTLPHRRDNK